jgi:hypothetical protein
MNNFFKEIFSPDEVSPRTDYWISIDEPPSFNPFGAPVLKGSLRYRLFVRKNGSPNRKLRREVLEAEFRLPEVLEAEFRLPEGRKP